MKNIIFITAGFIILSAAVFGTYKFFFDKNNEKKISISDELYVCPMHPQIQSNHPGVCPICNMDLVLKENVSEASDSTNKSANESGDVVLSPSQQVIANVQTEIVSIKEYRNDLSFNGFIKTGENNMRHISTPVSGKIIKMFVNFEGQMVSKGQPVFELYSPEIYSTQKEYLLALQNLENARSSNNNLIIGQAESIINSTKTRMSLWEVTDEQIKEIENTREVKNFITVHSKYSGVITKKIDHEGHWASAGEDVYDIVDMSTLWIIANVPESEISNIRMNQSAKIRTVAYPDEIFNAKVNFISPMLNSETRTLEIRLDVSNRNYKLKPDMYVKVEIGSVKYEWNILIPGNALLRTGKMDLVYVKKGNNTFSPRMVTVGGERDGSYLITSGLQEGDEIVTSAGFLIDSESKIRSGSSSQNMEGMDMEKRDEMKINKDQDVMEDMKR